MLRRYRVDAVKGFNHIVNTDRARRLLAILARSGQFLPRRLTFGPHNGPEDFCYVIDRIYSPGRNQKRRYCKEWLAYVDDTTIRAGSVLDGRWHTDAETADPIDDATFVADAFGYPSARTTLEANGVPGTGAGGRPPSGPPWPVALRRGRTVGGGK